MVEKVKKKKVDFQGCEKNVPLIMGVEVVWYNNLWKLMNNFTTNFWGFLAKHCS